MVLQTVAWLFLPAVVYGVLAYAFLEETPRPWPRAARRLGHRLRLGMDDRVSRLPGHRERDVAADADPFDALGVQMALGRLADQVRALEADPRVFARGRRLQAAQAAYDALLIEACTLAGVAVSPEARDTVLGTTREPERFREEMELSARGWSW